MKFWIWFWTFPIWTCDKFDQNLFCHIISMHNRLYGQVFFFKVYDTGFVFIFWLFEWKVCLMYNSQDSYIGIYSHFPKLYLSTFHAVARPKTFWQGRFVSSLWPHCLRILTGLQYLWMTRDEMLYRRVRHVWV